MSINYIVSRKEIEDPRPEKNQVTIRVLDLYPSTRYRFRVGAKNQDEDEPNSDWAEEASQTLGVLCFLKIYC